MTVKNALRERTVDGLHAALANKVRQHIPLPARILDVGCGTGAWLKRLRDLGYLHLQGTDLDTQQFGLPDISVYANDLNSEAWMLGGQSYQFVTAIEVVEHLQNIGHFFRNIRACLDVDGQCLLTTPNVHSLHARLRYLLTCDMKQFGRIGDPTHLFPMLDVTLRRMALLNGFEVVETWGYPTSGDAVGARPWVNAACRLLRRVLPDPLPGDVYCVLLRKVPE